MSGEDERVKKVQMMLKPGQGGSFTKVITSKDIQAFADIVGDTNPIHLDEKAAKSKGFDRRISHGMLTGSLISTVIGTIFPGEGTIYLEQNLKFLKPVYEEEQCTANVEVDKVLKLEKGIYRLKTWILNSMDDTVVDGYAVVKFSNA